nr:hypothetical protein Itr_chr01CG17780 [Ipomoea trifida]GMC50033.1 hypothetical protein Iba_chr01bCG13230 [Ipomoea batatas]GMC51970.1 hypothetical protein Iba_chr01cCG11210 [Ipomoea batatas]GMC53915.1 hypothetical protein Iba_chr01dCG11170 [Ipomoea batatas]GMC55767.1 hypothetical protein Iba_chr01fCG0830 [Ipomoea batatas]
MEKTQICVVNSAKLERRLHKGEDRSLMVAICFNVSKLQVLKSNLGSTK